MTYRIVMDSSGELPLDYFEDTGINFSMVPLTIHGNNKVYVDDDHLSVNEMLKDMKESKTAFSTACPSPEAFRDEFIKDDATFAITISDKLSGCYNSAMIGKNLAIHDYPDKKVHVIDSAATSSLMILIARKLAELIGAGKFEFDEIVSRIEEYRKTLSLYFVLQSFDNLVKAGRMNRFLGTLAGTLRICPVCGDNGKGEIKIYEKARGEAHALRRMVELIAARCPVTKGRTLVITHCNNPVGAQLVRDLAKKMYKFGEIMIFPMRGLASYYANDQGIIIGF